jgi:hypothetical protein
MLKDVIKQLQTKKEIIQYIVETDRIIGKLIKNDNPKPLHELYIADRDQLENYLYMRCEFLKLLIDKNP